MSSVPSRAEVETGLIAVLTDMTRDWGLDPDETIGPETKLIDDLGFESIDLVQLVVAIEERSEERRVGKEC